ncbi:MAG: hypothetical protein M3304_12215 [Actinomycetota bacterium]|nr:hypothetical protein [Actinomycetota bacterium]
MANHLGLALQDLAEAELDLADEWVKVGERHAVEHDVFHMAETLSREGRAHAERLVPFLERYGARSSKADGADPGESRLAGLRRKTSELLGREPAAGLLLLADLQRLYVMTEEASIGWTIAGQAAQAARDPDLLALVTVCHGETLMQAKWLTTRIKEAAPQTLVVG